MLSFTLKCDPYHSILFYHQTFNSVDGLIERHSRVSGNDSQNTKNLAGWRCKNLMQNFFQKVFVAIEFNGF